MPAYDDPNQADLMKPDNKPALRGGKRNNARTWTTVSIVLTLLGALMLLAGILLDSYDFYWMILVGLLIGLSFLILSLIFAAQARRLDRLFNRDRELLAYWTFDMSQQEKKVEQEYQSRKSANKIMLLVVLFFFVVISILFLIFGFDDLSEAGLFLAIMFGIAGLISLVALLAPGAARRRMRRSSPEVFVGPYSAWVMGEYTQWKAPMTRLNRVLLRRDKQDLVIDIDFSSLQRYGYQQHHCRIPVAAGHEDEGARAAMDIASINKVAFIPIEADEQV